jgi:hypothetical protein
MRTTRPNAEAEAHLTRAEQATVVMTCHADAISPAEPIVDVVVRGGQQQASGADIYE